MMKTWRSILARPLTTLYAFASLVVVAASAGWVDRNTAVVAVFLMFVAMLTLGLHRENSITSDRVEVELSSIHEMVNSQHTELVARVAELIETLEQAGVAVPAPRKDETR